MTIVLPSVHKPESTGSDRVHTDLKVKTAHIPQKVICV